ncbi:estradiol 17-beta-dehydrogenase 2 [Labrus bergylta]|uniref:estradiol 17-beta-dehydrogenase 2 n=1 Tax=Labrus bergylta TaxID=56723 RepID=UPI003313ADB8
MEITSCFCWVSAAVFVITLLWRFIWGGGTHVGALIGALGASLCFILPPVYRGVALLGCSFILTFVTERRGELLQAGGRAVLVTGCDSGFGHALAKRLSDEGLQVFAGVLDVNGGGAQQLRERGSEKLKVLQLDVTDSSQIETVHRYICTQVEDTGLWGLVNNAGVLQCPTDAELHPITWYSRCMDVNFLSAVRMCQVFLPLLRRSRGRIVNVTSMAGEVPLPMFSSYGASKAAISMFSRVLRMEMCVWGVRVTLIQPGGFRTSIFGNSEDVSQFTDEVLAAVSPEAREDYGKMYISSLPGFLSKMSQQSSEDLSPVVEDMHHALLSVHPRPLYTPGQMAWLLPLLHRCCPAAVSEFLIRRLFVPSACRPTGLTTS